MTTTPPPQPAFTCPSCGRTSHHPKDFQYGYCGACHAYTGDTGRFPEETTALLTLTTTARQGRSRRGSDPMDDPSNPSDPRPIAPMSLHEPTVTQLLVTAVHCAWSGTSTGRSLEWITHWRNVAWWLAKHADPELVDTMCQGCQQTGWKFRDEAAPDGRIWLCHCPLGRSVRRHLDARLDAAESPGLGRPGDLHTLVSEAELVARLAAETRVNRDRAYGDDPARAEDPAEVAFWSRARRWLVDKLPDEDALRLAEQRAAVAMVMDELRAQRVGSGWSDAMLRALATAVVYRRDQAGALHLLDDDPGRDPHLPFLDAVTSAVGDRLNALGSAAGLAPIEWYVARSNDVNTFVHVHGYVSEAVHGPAEAFELERRWAALLGLELVEPDSGTGRRYRGMVDHYLDVMVWRVGGAEPYASAVPTYQPTGDAS